MTPSHKITAIGVSLGTIIFVVFFFCWIFLTKVNQKQIANMLEEKFAEQRDELSFLIENTEFTINIDGIYESNNESRETKKW